MNEMDSSLILAELDKEISREQLELATATAGAVTRIMALVSQRERVMLAAHMVSGIHVSASPAAEPVEKLSAPALILRALRQSPDGLKGERLHEIGRDAGLSKAAIDRTRSRLKNAGKIATRGALWIIAEHQLGNLGSELLPGE